MKTKKVGHNFCTRGRLKVVDEQLLDVNHVFVIIIQITNRNCLIKMDIDSHDPQIVFMDENHRLSMKKTNQDKPRLRQKGHLVPGEVITDDSGFMRGHGTYIQDNSLISSVAGFVEPINRLISVRALKTRYNGEVGDVVVGRIIEVQVQHKRWKVETNSRVHSMLLISSVNLPDGNQRRKTAEDEQMMRSYFTEGDLISAEVQSIFSDGSLSLHTRSPKYAKLGQGILIIVSPSLIERRKTHFHNLPCGAHVILGNNGYIWISLTAPGSVEAEGFACTLEKIDIADRQILARLRNCIAGLARFKMTIQDTSITYSYDASVPHSLQELMLDEVMSQVVDVTRQKMMSS